MNENKGTLIHYTIAALVRAPIKAGGYEINDATIQVSYLQGIEFTESFTGTKFIEYLPVGISTLFEVKWIDTDGKFEKRLRSRSSERFLSIHFALDRINLLLLAFKIEKVDKNEGKRIHLLGEEDVLFSNCTINNKGVPGTMNGGEKYTPHHIAEADPTAVTDKAIRHINQDTFPIGRRFIRCIELFERGYYTECLLITYAILEDSVVNVLKLLMTGKGLSENEQQKHLRRISSQRMKKYLHSELIRLHGKSIIDIWPKAKTALKWFNDERNLAMHAGYLAERRVGALSLYVCAKTIVVLWQEDLIQKQPLSVKMYREAKIKAAWAEDSPSWVPKGKDASVYEFN